MNIDVGVEREILEALREMPEVKEAHIVYGVYDLVVKVEVQGEEELGKLVTGKLRKLSGVRATLTMVSVEGFRK